MPSSGLRTGPGCLVLFPATVGDDHGGEAPCRFRVVDADGAVITSVDVQPLTGSLGKPPRWRSPRPDARWVLGGVRMWDWVLGAVLLGFAFRANGDEAAAIRQWSEVSRLSKDLKDWLGGDGVEEIVREWVNAGRRSAEPGSQRGFSLKLISTTPTAVASSSSSALDAVISDTRTSFPRIAASTIMRNSSAKGRPASAASLARAMM